MKPLNLFLLGLQILSLAACNEKRMELRPGIEDEIVSNTQKATKDQLLERYLELAEKNQQRCRRTLRNSASPQEIALATEDLRQANDAVSKLEAEIRANQ